MVKYQNIIKVSGMTTSKGPLELFQKPTINTARIKALNDISFPQIDFLSTPTQVTKARVIKIVPNGRAFPVPISN